jgi:hypothetical protein
VKEISNTSNITIDPRLDAYNETILFPEKVEDAKAVIQKVGLPKGNLLVKKQPKFKPLTTLQKELLSIYALEPNPKEMEEIKEFMHALFEKKLEKSI